MGGREQLTKEIIIDIAVRHLTPEELEWVGRVFKNNPKKVYAAAHLKEGVIGDEAAVAEWLKELAQSALMGGDA